MMHNNIYINFDKLIFKDWIYVPITDTNTYLMFQCCFPDDMLVLSKGCFCIWLSRQTHLRLIISRTSCIERHFENGEDDVFSTVAADLLSLCSSTSDTDWQWNTWKANRIPGKRSNKDLEPAADLPTRHPCCAARHERLVGWTDGGD